MSDPKIDRLNELNGSLAGVVPNDFTVLSGVPFIALEDGFNLEKTIAAYHTFSIYGWKTHFEGHKIFL